MKLTIVLLTVFALHVSAKGIAQQVTFSGRAVPLEQVFAEVRKQTGYFFLYAEKAMFNAQPVTISAKNMPLKDFLEKIFKGQPLAWTISSKTITITRSAPGASSIAPGVHPPAPLLELIPPPVTIQVLGTDDKPLAGVSVTNRNNKKSGMTNIEGMVELDVQEGDLLEFSFIGYKKLLHKVRSGNRITLQMEIEPTELSTSVVIGYGSVRRKDLTGSVSSISPNEVKNVPFVTLDAAMAGKAPGLQVTKADGSPGGAVRIRIRGGSSLIGANDPLYIIDGVPVLVENKFIATTDMTNPVENYGGGGNRNTSISGSFSRGLNNLAGLNMDDIETIDILKDASATAIYGSKAANGVVIINTKKGKQNQKPVLELNYYTGISKAVREKVLNAEQYKLIILEAATNRVNEDARLNRTTDNVAKALVANPGLLGDGSVDTDWLGLVLRTGITQNASVAVRGGGSGSRYYTSLAYSKNQGTLIGSDFSRISGKVSLDNEISSKLRVITNMDYGFSKTDVTNGVYNNALMAPPILKPYNADGSFSILDRQLAALTTAGGGLDYALQNPVAMATAINQGKNITLLGSISAEYNILKSLLFKSTASVNYSNYRQRNYIPSYLEIANPNGQGGQSSSGGAGSLSSSTTTNSFFENTLTWDKQFNDHHRLTLLGGTSWEKYTSEFFSAEGRGFPNDTYLNNLSSATTPTSVKGSSPSDEYALLSFYARANYAFKERYLFTFTGRNDISSKFAQGNRAAYFPSGAVAWRVSEEKFMNGINWLNELKLRASIGYTGSQSIGNYLYRSLYSPASYAGASAFIPTQLGNNEIEWERTLQKDLGIDFAILNNRIRGSFGFYEKNTDGLLLNLTPPPSYAYSSVFMNIARVRNRGLELELRSEVINTKNFSWNMAFNIAGNRSKVTEIRGGPFSDPNDRNALNLGSSIVREGDPLGLIYGNLTLGIAQTPKDAADYLAAVYNAQVVNRWFNAGDMKYDTTLLAQSGAIRLLNYRQDVIGNINPKFFGGFTNTFNYKNISLTAHFNYSYGNDILFQGDVRDRGVNNTYNKGVRVLDRWTAENPNSNRPRLLYGRNEIRSDQSVFDGSFLKLKSLSIGYELPRKAAGRLGLRTASFYCSATNLFVITSYPGPDPEVSDDPRSIIGGGRDIGSYPTTRELTVGFRLGL